MKHACTFVIVYFLLAISLFAQPEIEWQRSFGGSLNEHARSVIQTTDGGYAIAGSTVSIDGDVFGSHGYYECWILKLDASGNVAWKKPYGGSDYEVAYDIEQTPDGGYIFVGITFSSNQQVSGHQGKGDYWVVKLDANGVIEWQRTLGGSERDEAYAIKRTPDGGYIVAGSSESSDGDVSVNRGGKDYWVVKLNHMGDVEWERSYGGQGYDICFAIAVCSDGGYIVGGESNSIDGQVSDPFSNGDFWVVKLNFDGKIEWEKSLGGNGIESAYEILEDSAGGFTVMGETSSFSGHVIGNHGMVDVWVVKLNEEGEIVWQSTLGGSNLDYANSLAQTEDGGYVLLGSTQSTDGDVMGNDGGADLWVVKINEVGELVWQKAIGGTKAEYGYDIIQSTDGGYVTAGFTWSNNGDVTQNKGKNDMWIVKLSPETTPTQAPITHSLQLYPNPTTDRIYWQMPASDSYNELNIRILNTFGQVVRHIPVYTEMSLDVSDLSAGLYLLEVSTASGEKLLGRFLKP